MYIIVLQEITIKYMVKINMAEFDGIQNGNLFMDFIFKITILSNTLCKIKI